jgi:uncharacterized protein YoaH (UPF0181 family)
MTIKQRAVEEVQNFLQYGMTFYEAQSEAIRIVKDKIEQKENNNEDFKGELDLLEEICKL